ncbi:MAG: hypothetical protein O3B41_01035 [Bacteroidetes bacterium]|nr:hypothetical protein [Bacteroidota bacterium]
MNIRVIIWLAGLALLPQLVVGQIFTFPTPGNLSGNFFGSAVAVDGDLAVVGSSGFDSCGTNSGAAFVYQRHPDSTWKLTSVLQPSDCQEDHFFGKTVAVSGNRILVTSFRSSFNQRESNGVYIFERDESFSGDVFDLGPSNAVGVASIPSDSLDTPSNVGKSDENAQEVAASPDTVSVTSVTNTINLSSLTGRGWKQKTRISDPDRGEFGTFATAVSLDHNRLLVTAAGHREGNQSRGAGYVFDLQKNGQWLLSSRLTADQLRFNGVFGTSCDLDGDRLVISSSSYTPGKPGRIAIYDLDPDSNDWRVTDTIEDVVSFFMPLDLSGDRLLIGESNAGRNQSGRARLFELADQKWNLKTTFSPALPYDFGAFGTLVSMSGDHVLIVGFDEQLELSINVDRVVYVFHNSMGEWRQRNTLDVGNPFFGSALSFTGKTAVIGQSSENTPGQVYSVDFNRP